MDAAAEARLTERASASPAYIGVWSLYRRSVYEDVSEWSLRWISVQNGVLFVYMDDIMSAPEGSVTLHNSAATIEFNDLSDKEFIIRMTSGDEVHEFKLEKTQEILMREVIHRNVCIERNRHSLSDFYMEDVDEVQPASMQIHLKGVPHTISIRPTENATAIAEMFVSEHKLKNDITYRIEMELLRTQIDACLVFQSKLRQHISHLRRLLIDAAVYESRAINAESRVLKLIEMGARVEDALSDFRKKLAALQSHNRDLSEECAHLRTQVEDQRGLICSLEQENSSLRKEQIRDNLKLDQAVQHCRLLQGKLRAASQWAYALGAETGNVPFDTNNGQYGLGKEALDARVARAVSEATRSLVKEYEQKMALYEKTVTEQSMQLETMTKEMAVDKRSIMTLKRDLSAATQALEDGEFRAQIEREERGYLSKIAKLEENIGALTQQMSDMRAANQSLKTRYDMLDLNYTNVRDIAHQQEEELIGLRERLKDARTLSSSKAAQKLREENLALNEQIVVLRGEIIQLQNQVDEVQESAIRAVQVVQLLDDKDDSAAVTMDMRNSQRGLTRDDLTDTNGGTSSAHDDGEVIVELTMEESDEENAGKEQEDQGEIYTEVEVDLALQQSLADLKLEEKSAASLSPVVEDRLLRNIYHKYTLETTGLLNLSRFGRFTKEFKIAGNISVTGEREKSKSAMLVYGDVDVTFMTVLKRVPSVESDMPMSMTAVEQPSSRQSHSAAFIPAGSIRYTEKSTTPTAKALTAAQMTAKQFIAAVEELAVRLYAHVIEERTGTVLDCLPPKQRSAAVRAAVDVLMLQKIVPTAEKLGLVPWELMVLDQTLTTIHSSNTAQNSLSTHINTVNGWFTHYSKVLHIAQKSPDAARKSLSKSFSMNSTGAFPSSAYDMRASLGSFSIGSRATPTSPTHSGPPESFRGIAYKEISRFFHDYGIVSYLLKEPQLHSIFKEVCLWASGNVELLLVALPEDIRDLPSVQQELNASPSMRNKLAKKNVIGLGSFYVLYSAVAMQAFKDLDPESRIGRLFQWSAQSGGSYLMQRKQLY